MTRRSLWPPDAAQGAARELRDARHQLADPAYEDSPAADSLGSLTLTIPGVRSGTGCGARKVCTARLRAGSASSCRATSPAGVISGGGWLPCGSPVPRLLPLGRPVVELELQALERIIGWQARTVASHLGEARRLRDLAGHSNGPEGPAAALAPGQTISGETTPQPGGCGQAGGA